MAAVEQPEGGMESPKPDVDTEQQPVVEDESQSEQIRQDFCVESILQHN